MKSEFNRRFGQIWKKFLFLMSRRAVRERFIGSERRCQSCATDHHVDYRFSLHFFHVYVFFFRELVYFPSDSLFLL